MFPNLNQEESQNKGQKFWAKFTTKDRILVCCMALGLVFVITGFVMQFIHVAQAKAVSKDELELGARTAAALTAAGGISDDADKSYIAQSINLSKTVTDEEKIYIPVQQATANTSVQQTVSDVEVTLSPNTISINTATSTQLETLPRIGAVTAQKIINGRPYVSVNDLISKKILSEGVFEEISKMISI